MAAVCGIVAIARGAGAKLSLSQRQAARVRDALAHRGPDGAGSWESSGLYLGQRRLEVISPGEAGRQPMASRDGRWVIVYNGELYNDADMRGELGGLGQEPYSPSDTATMCQVLSAWGAGGLRRCRGMFALVAYDTVERRLVMARDPLGIKPLYFAFATPADGCGAELVIASEAAALFEHPRLSPGIDVLGLSAYLATIRLCTEGRTLFQGVSMLPPGRVVEFDLRSEGFESTAWDLPIEGWSPDDNTGVRGTVEESVALHLRSDVPVCVLLSGGLDSTIIAAETRRHRLSLPTFGAGDDRDDPQGDAEQARRLAESWGLPHTAIRMTQERFAQGVRTLIDRTGQPVGTPNETAIHALGCAIRAYGCKVALTGEGADELFGGYDGPLRRALAYIDSGGEDPAADFLLSNCWVGPQALPVVLHPRIFAMADAFGWLLEEYRRAFEIEAARPGVALLPRGEALRGHMRLVRRMNLTGLLQRVDSALSQSGVEGRTPLADRVVASCADSLPMEERYRPDEPLGTKVAFRRAFADVVPRSVLERPKASFPLPFQDWMGPLFADVGRAPIVDELFNREAWDVVSSDPASHWQLAWPMVNAALWARRWFG